MGARINNFPVYAVYDRTYTADITTEVVNTWSSPVNAITGTTQDTRDKDLATYLGWTNAGSSGSGSNNASYSVIYDFGKVIWNTQIYAKFDGNADLGFGGGTLVSVSTNGVDWTDIDNTPGLQTSNYFVMNMRYLRFKAYITDAIGFLKVYEVKVMGSD